PRSGGKRGSCCDRRRGSWSGSTTRTSRNPDQGQSREEEKACVAGARCWKSGLQRGLDTPFCYVLKLGPEDGAKYGWLHRPRCNCGKCKSRVEASPGREAPMAGESNATSLWNRKHHLQAGRYGSGYRTTGRWIWLSAGQSGDWATGSRHVDDELR